MSTRSFRIMPLITSVIMAVAAGCGSAHDAASSAGQPDPEDILSPHYAAEVEQGTLVESMLGPAS